MQDQSGKTNESVLAAARTVASETGVSADVLLAVAIVETGARPHAVFEERSEPLIRFEGHCFDRFLSAPDRARARAAGLSSPRAGAIANPSEQAARWRLLDRASAIDAKAAYASTSWGLGQVMGAHWKALGYRDAAALAAEARGSVEGQFRLVAKFLMVDNLHRRLEGGDIAGFSRAYNGPAYRKNGYDTKIAAALAEARRRLAATAATMPPVVLESQGKRSGMPAEGWSKRGPGLSSVTSWLLTLFSTRAATRSSSTSTARSSASTTTRQPSPWNRASSMS